MSSHDDAGLLPPDEQQRLATLTSLDILDTGTERSFDDIVELAATMCDVPVALISFVDRDRQWFKAKYGWKDESTPRSIAFCARTILGVQALVVEDATHDERFVDNPLVTGDPFVRFYAGVPLRVGHDSASGVGSLCVVDTEPRQLSDTVLASLEVLARQVEQMLESRLLVADHRRQAVETALLRERYRAITESMLCGIVVHARDGAIESVNPAAEWLLGATIDQMRGVTPMHPMWDCVRADGSPFPGDQHPASVTLRDGIEVRDVVMGVRLSDGRRRWIVVASSPVTDATGAADGAVATFVDITNEFELRDRLEQSLSVIRTSMREHAALTAAITHDLAAPAATTRIYADLVAGGLDGSEQVHAVEALRQHAHRTEQLVADLGTVATRMRSDETPTRVESDLAGIVRRACARAERAVELEPPAADTHAEVDVVQIERLLDNLLSNVAKHTPADVTARITLAGDTDMVTITVDDDGPGVPESERERIFDAFQRLPASSTTAGSGVGLYLVRQFARFHGGDAACGTSPGGGSRFTVTIARRTAVPTPSG